MYLKTDRLVFLVLADFKMSCRFYKAIDEYIA